MKSIINNIEVKLEKIIQKLGELELEKSDLQKNNHTLNERLQEKDNQISSLQDKVKLMNISKSVDSDSEDLKATKLKINEYVREIDKCIALLNK